MLPGNVDPRRPDKVQRYKPNSVSNGQGEDLTTDYMNILGQQGTTANADQLEVGASGEPTAKMDEQPIARSNEQIPAEQPNIIPTSPQYGVAIIPENADNGQQPDATEPPKTTLSSVAEDSAKTSVDPQSTTSRNDRFKVVKIASLEPFKRGRWKCMDYMDECPPGSAPTIQSKTQSTTNLQSSAGGPIFMQTQSLPQQQFQQILMQGGVYQNTQTGHFFPNQIMPNQTQYFYTTQQQNSVSQQLVGVPQFVAGPQFYPVQTGQPNSGIPNQTAFAVPTGYQNATLQYVPIQQQQQANGSSAFVPTCQQQQIQLVGYQQGQTYAGQHQQQPLVNGHGTAYPAQQQNSAESASANQIAAASMPNQSAKSIIVQTAATGTVVSSQVPIQVTGQPIQLVANQAFQPTAGQFHQQGQQQSTLTVQQPPQAQVSSQQMFKEGGGGGTAAATSSVYTNPQFATSVNSLAGLGTDASEMSDHQLENAAAIDATAVVDPMADDPARTNPVVNAIDNKIEQAMDLVKSHLMYTVREEVEVLKEKIAELMERIQQLETENNYLRSQIPKNQQTGCGTAGQNGGTTGSETTPPTQPPPSSQQ